MLQGVNEMNVALGMVEQYYVMHLATTGSTERREEATKHISVLATGQTAIQLTWKL